MKNLLRVTVIYKDGTASSYNGISRISPSYEGDKLFLLKDLTEEEMSLYNRNPEEDEDFITCTIENTKEATILIAVM